MLSAEGKLDLRESSAVAKKNQDKVAYLADNILKCYSSTDFSNQQKAHHFKLLHHFQLVSTNLTEIGECLYDGSKILHVRELSNVSRLADSICGKFKGFFNFIEIRSITTRDPAEVSHQSQPLLHFLSDVMYD